MSYKSAVIIGQGDVNEPALRQFAGAMPLIALDGAADYLAQQGLQAETIIGDMDSLHQGSDSGHHKAAHHIQIDEQDSNDFEKALYHLTPSTVVGLGLFGKRFDHSMANLHLMAKYQHRTRIIAVTNDEIITVHKGPAQLASEAGGLVAVIPLAPMRFESSLNLGYGLAGLALGFGTMISSSNHATASQIEIVPEAEFATISYAVCRPLCLLQTMPLEAL